MNGNSSRLIVAPVAGSLLGVILALLSLSLSEVSDEVLLLVYVIVVFLVSASLTLSPRAGLILGLFVVIGGALAELTYFLTFRNIDVSLLPYAAGFILFAGRIPLYPLAGMLGGYIGEEYFREKKRSRKTGKS